MRLRQKIILLIVPVIVIPMMISGWLSYSQLKTTAIEKSKQQMETLLEQYALYADAMIHGAESNIRLFANNELLRRYMVTQSERERYEILQPLLLKQLQNYQQAYPLYYEIRVIFPDGFEDLRLVNRRVDNITMHEADTPFVKDILAQQEDVFSRIVHNPDNDEVALSVAIALNLKDRSIEATTSVPKFRGYLVLTIDISEVIRQMELNHLGADGFIFIANNNGTAELYAEKMEAVLKNNGLSQAQMNRLGVDTAATDVVGGVDLSHKPIIETTFLGDDGYMKAVKIHEDLILVTWLPFNEISEKTGELGLIVISMTLIAVLVTVLLLFALLNYFVLRPIQQLRSAAIEIGRGKLSTPVNISLKDELGDLAGTFDDMRKNMLRSHENLEKQVDERTLEVRQALESVEKSSQAKSNFLSRMSHELRTPLNAILGFSQLFEYDQNLTANQKTNAREINNAGEHLLSLIDEVLDLSKIEAGRLELSLETISLAKVLDNCCVLTAGLAKAHGISVGFEENKCNDLYVYADYMRAKQVFLNLMTNAVKYNQEHGRVNIFCTKMHDGYIRINVSDTGPGIADDKLSQLFEPFNRLGAEFSKTEGTGIGLLITKQLVELMDGRLGIESEAGKGCIFWVELKQSEASKSRSGVEYRDEPLCVNGFENVATDRVRILVAEDNETNQEVLRQQLHLLGYHADFAENGLVAMEMWRAGEYHLLLTDVHMPQMDGYELVSRIQKTEKYAEHSIPIIAITADAMQGQAQRCLDAGMNDYVAKPVHLQELKYTLNKWLSQQYGQAAEDSVVNDMPVAADTDAEAAIDRNVLTQIVGADEASHRQLLQTFVHSTPAIIEQIQLALSSRDANAMLAQVHKLKSSSRSMGAIQLSATCEALEVATRNPQWTEIESLVVTLDELYQAVEYYVAETFAQD